MANKLNLDIIIRYTEKKHTAMTNKYSPWVVHVIQLITYSMCSSESLLLFEEEKKAPR